VTNSLPSRSWCRKEREGKGLIDLLIFLLIAGATALAVSTPPTVVK
jgi:hypothetical protein